MKTTGKVEFCQDTQTLGILYSGIDTADERERIPFSVSGSYLEDNLGLIQHLRDHMACSEDAAA